MVRGACVVALLLLVSGASAPQELDRAKSAFTRAVELEAAGNHAAALSLFWEAAGHAPRDPEILNRLGEALERIGALEAAIDAFRRAVTERPDFRTASNNLILTLVKAGHRIEAVERARAAVAAAPRDADRHFTLGLALSEVDTEAAEASFHRALALAPGHTLARYNLALVLRRADRLAEAIAELRRVIDADARAEAYYLLGVTYWHAGDGERARRALADALALAPDHADAHHTLGAVLRAEGDWRGAARALRRALDLRPDLWGAHHALGQVLQRMGDGPAAAHHLAEAERLRRLGQLEREAAVWTAVGIGRLDAGQLLHAVDAFRRATTVLETWAPAHYQLGRAFAALEEHDAARSAFERARQLNPSLVPPSASVP